MTDVYLYCRCLAILRALCYVRVKPKALISVPKCCLAS